jgi:hypothetical protein
MMVTHGAFGAVAEGTLDGGGAARDGGGQPVDAADVLVEAVLDVLRQQVVGADDGAQDVAAADDADEFLAVADGHAAHVVVEYGLRNIGNIGDVGLRPGRDRGCGHHPATVWGRFSPSPLAARHRWAAGSAGTRCCSRSASLTMPMTSSASLRNPYPLSALNHFTVPIGIGTTSFPQRQLYYPRRPGDLGTWMPRLLLRVPVRTEARAAPGVGSIAANR